MTNNNPILRPCNYLSLDLELNGPDIIQVGVSIGSVFTDPGDYITRSWYLQPKSGLPIQDRIVELTGISQNLLDERSVTHESVANELSELIQEHKVFVNPVQWGLTDAQELLSEFKELGVSFPHFGRRVIDVKMLYLYVEIANGRSLSGGLRGSMGRHGLQFTGTPHRADMDAFNTLRFFSHLVSRQQTLESARINLSDLKR